jgi:hypothetical protein
MNILLKGLSELSLIFLRPTNIDFESIKVLSWGGLIDFNSFYDPHYLRD